MDKIYHDCVMGYLDGSHVLKKQFLKKLSYSNRRLFLKRSALRN